MKEKVAPPSTAQAGGDDDALLSRFIEGDRSAFDALVQKYQRSIYFLAMRYVKDHDDATDIAQRAFVRAFIKLPEFERRASFKTWLYRIAVNLCLNHLRDRGRWQKASLDDVELVAPAQAPNGIEEQERAETLAAAVEALPPKQRQTLELRVYGDLSFKEIAAAMDCSEGTAKVNFHYAVKKLVKGKPT